MQVEDFFLVLSFVKKMEFLLKSYNPCFSANLCIFTYFFLTNFQLKPVVLPFFVLGKFETETQKNVDTKKYACRGTVSLVRLQ